MGVMAALIMSIMLAVGACGVCVPVAVLFKLYLDRRRLWYSVAALSLSVIALIMFFPLCMMLNIVLMIHIVESVIFWATYSVSAALCILLFAAGIKSKRWWSIFAIYGGTAMLLPDLLILALTIAYTLGILKM